MLCTPAAFRKLANNELGTQLNGDQSFRAKVGCSPDVCSTLWEMLSIKKRKPLSSKPKHLLWTLLFLKLYAPGTVLAETVCTSRDVFSNWVWIMLESISDLVGAVVSNS